MACVCFRRKFKSLFIGFILYNTVIFTSVIAKNHVEVDISYRSIFPFFAFLQHFNGVFKLNLTNLA